MDPLLIAFLVKLAILSLWIAIPFTVKSLKNGHLCDQHPMYLSGPSEKCTPWRRKSKFYVILARSRVRLEKVNGTIHI